MDPTVDFKELVHNLVELQAIIDKVSKMSIEKLSKGDKLRLATINEYINQGSVKLAVGSKGC